MAHSHHWNSLDNILTISSGTRDPRSSRTTSSTCRFFQQWVSLVVVVPRFQSAFSQSSMW